MKHLKFPITKEGFRASREYLNFRSDTILDLEASIAGLFDGHTAFIKGGVTTIVDGSNFTVSDGIAVKDGKLYQVTGGAFTGVPGDYYIAINDDVAAAGYPQQDYASEVGEVEDVFLNRTGIITTTAAGNTPLTDFQVFDLLSTLQAVQTNETAIEQITETDTLIEEGDIVFVNCQTELAFQLRSIEDINTATLLGNVSVSATSAVSQLEMRIQKANFPAGALPAFQKFNVGFNSDNPLGSFSYLDVEIIVTQNPVRLYVRTPDGSNFPVGEAFIFGVDKMFRK